MLLQNIEKKLIMILNQLNQIMVIEIEWLLITIIGLNFKAEDINFLLERAFNKRTITNNNLVIRTDIGTQFTSKIFKYKINELNLYYERIPMVDNKK